MARGWKWRRAFLAGHNSPTDDWGAEALLWSGGTSRTHRKRNRASSNFERRELNPLSISEEWRRWKPEGNWSKRGSSKESHRWIYESRECNPRSGKVSLSKSKSLSQMFWGRTAFDESCSNKTGEFHEEDDYFCFRTVANRMCHQIAKRRGIEYIKTLDNI